MRNFSFLTLALMILSQLALAGPNAQKPLPTLLKFSPPAISYTINERTEVSLFVDIPCAGEFVILEGPLHSVYHVTINGNNFIVKSHYQPQGISGTGSISGDKYQATGVTQDNSKGSAINGQYTATFVNNFRIIGQGPGNNFLIHQTSHITFNANGIVTAEVDNTTVECK